MLGGRNGGPGANSAVGKFDPSSSHTWKKTAGPVASLVATLHRIDWRMLAPSILKTDEGRVLDLEEDPPATVAFEAKAAVRRWRWQKIGKHLPHLIPDRPDIVVQDTGESRRDRTADRDVHFDFADIYARVMRNGCKQKIFDSWQPKYKPSLLSATSGGQWPQTRLLVTRKWTDDPKCQLCQRADGTLLHRHECPATIPEGGWPAPSKRVQDFVQSLHPSRRHHLITRGLLSLKVRPGREPEFDSFKWLFGDADVPHDARWYIDGSLYDSRLGPFKRTGFAIAVVSSQGDLLAYGNGNPPEWIQDAAGAEAWAFATVLGLNPDVPYTTTDCMNILTMMQKGRSAATEAKSPLARTWARAYQALECNLCTPEQIDRIRWMPAHCSMVAIGVAKASDGAPISPVDWRANRLVDKLAKLAASRYRVPAAVTRLLSTAAEAAEYYAARLGAVTYAANNYLVSTVLPDGTTTNSIRRDSTAVSPVRHAEKGQKRKHQQTSGDDGCTTHDTKGSNTIPLLPHVAALSAKNAKKQRLQDHESICELRFQQNWRASKPAMRPTAQGSAQQRLRELRERVSARQAGSNTDTGH